MSIKKEYIPIRRFPDYSKEGCWSYVNANELFDPIVNKNHNADLPVLAITQDQGAVPREMIDYNVFVSEKSVAGYKIVEVGDFIISLRSFQGGIEYSKYKGLCSPAYIVLRKKNETICNDYYRHYFKSWQFIQDLNRNLEGIRDGKMISYQQFSEILIPYPPFAEQQKIADCLSSIDSYISLLSKKVEQLKVHKESLMQKMFPRKGQTVPDCRFPVFTQNKDWSIKKLNEVVGNIVTGKLDANAMVSNGRYRFYTCAKSFFYIDKYAFDTEALLISGNGAHVGYIHYYKGKFNAYQRTYVLSDFKCDVFFLKYFLEYSLPNRIKKEKKDGNTPYIVLSTLTDMPILLPEIEEQKRISKSLLLIDKLIDSNTDKVDWLKQQKIGLIQQLFPKL